MFAYLKGRPLPYSFASVYGFVFAMFYLLYGGIKLVLSFMDHNYEGLWVPIIFTLVGGALLIVAMGFRDLKNWGWYGLIVINAIAIILALFGISHLENILLVLLSGAALFGLFAPATRAMLFGQS